MESRGSGSDSVPLSGPESRRNAGFEAVFAPDSVTVSGERDGVV